MKAVGELKKILSEHKPEIKRKFKVKSIGIFGSYVRGKSNKKSDVDVLVEFSEPIGMFEFLDLEEYLESIFGLNVDLVSKKALKPKIGENILNEVIYIW
jgi:predicted nucleotidyltransferase